MIRRVASLKRKSNFIINFDPYFDLCCVSCFSINFNVEFRKQLRGKSDDFETDRSGRYDHKSFKDDRFRDRGMTDAAMVSHWWI